MLGDKKINQPAGCCICGFKDIYPSDTCCQKCGATLCDDAKKPAKSDLEKENYELKQQLAEVKNQLVKVLEELKELRNNSTGQNNIELDQQIDYNEKLIRHVEEVPETEIKEQIQKSEALLRNATVNSEVSPSQGKENNNGSLPYVIGGSVILVAVGIISYFLVKKNKKSKVN